MTFENICPVRNNGEWENRLVRCESKAPFSVDLVLADSPLNGGSEVVLLQPGNRYSSFNTVMGTDGFEWKRPPGCVGVK